MDAHRHDSPASPHCLGVGRRHSPWTASRQRKKNRQGDEHLPVCISEDEETQEASSMSKSCEDMIVDMQSMGFAMPRTDAGPAAHHDESAQSAHDTRRKPFLFMPCILQGALSSGIQQSSTSSGASSSFAGISSCLRTASANFLPGSRPVPGPAGCSVSPRRNSTGLIPWREQNNDTSAASFLSSLSPLALSTEHVSCSTTAAAAVRPGQHSSGDDQDQQRKSMKRRSLERTDGTLSQALRASGMDTVRGAVKELLPPVAKSPALRPRRRASVSKNTTSFLGRSGDQAPQKDQRLHSKSLPFPLEFEFQGVVPFGAHVQGEGLTPVSTSYEDTFRIFGLPESLDASCRTALYGSVAEQLSCSITPDAVDRAEEAEGFRILTVLTGNDLDLAGSSDRLARRDQHLRAASAGAAQLPRVSTQPPTEASSPLLQHSSWSVSDPDFDGDCEDLDDCSSSGRDEEEFEEDDDAQSSPMEGLALRLIHTEQDFQTPPQSPLSDEHRTVPKTSHQLASCYLASGLGTYERGHRNGGHDDSSADDEGSCCIPTEQLVTLEEFNRHLSKAAQLGNRCRADNLWAELCSKGVRPNVQTLNSFLRCLANSFASPDEAETLAREICKAGKLSPNSVTYNLLAETRFRYEQMGLL